MGTRGSDGLWADSYSPRKVRWWHTSLRRDYADDYTHFSVLRDLIFYGRSADETEALAHCYKRVTSEGAGHPVTGEWCVCLTENPPSAGEARGSIGGDGMSALVAVKADLERAADVLPITWTSTREIFEAQGRSITYQGRLLVYRRNLRVREIDRWMEPCDPDSGRPRSRQLAHFLMSRELGGTKDVYDWPRKAPAGEKIITTLLSMDEYRARRGQTQDDLQKVA